jgi:quercetin dioxygenase-like cupin family protein
VRQPVAPKLVGAVARGYCLASDAPTTPETAMSASKVTHYRWSDVSRENVTAHIDRKIITGDRMMIAQVFLKKGAIVPKHHHHNEQITYILEGALRFWIGDDEREVVDVRAGDVLTIPSNLPHKAEALEDTLDVDIFNPPREDWLDGTDAYLRQGNR